MVQWYCEILILVHFASDGTCQILKPAVCVILSDHRIIVPHLNDKWFFFHKLYHPKLLWLIHMVQWYCETLNFGSFCEWSLCVILSDHHIIVPHLNDKWFFFHKLYHPKLLWFIHMVQWYCEILILAHFASDGICQILKPMCHSEWPPYYCSTFKWQVILLS